jgi:hypothetical protein
MMTDLTVATSLPFIPSLEDKEVMSHCLQNSMIVTHRYQNVYNQDKHSHIYRSFIDIYIQGTLKVQISRFWFLLHRVLVVLVFRGQH